METLTKTTLKYYCFDWDDNLFTMPTKIYMEKYVNNKWIKQNITTIKYAKIRGLCNWRTPINAYDDFSDIGPRGISAFMEDLKIAIINKKYGPSWNMFKKCLIDGSIFSLITARGHESETIKNAVKYIIWNILTDIERNIMKKNLVRFKKIFNKNKSRTINNTDINILIENYLNNCYFIGVTSPTFLEKYDNSITPINPENCKILALGIFINNVREYGKIINGDISIGFSDDDIQNVNKVEKYFGELSQYDKNINYSIINTSNSSIIGGIKKRI